MFSAGMMAFFFAGMFVAVLAYQLFDKRNPSVLANGAAAFGCVASIYCLLAGCISPPVGGILWPASARSSLHKPPVLMVGAGEY
jgi:hypothetical protein